jgi:hypothetical protein
MFMQPKGYIISRAGAQMQLFSCRIFLLGLPGRDFADSQAARRFGYLAHECFSLGSLIQSVMEEMRTKREKSQG